MDIQVQVHLESGGEGRVLWWAESPQLPGFSAVGESLRDLFSRTTWAASDVLAEVGDQLGQVEFEIVADEPATYNPSTVIAKTGGNLRSGRVKLTAA